MDKGLIKILASSQVGRIVELDGLDVRAVHADYACNNCIFETVDKSYNCKFKDACMAHLREDKQSIVFVNVKKK